jgi:Xaa-Pro aminopeptidase
MITCQRGVDWADRIDYRNLREGRLSKVKNILEKNDITALVAFEPNNIRYIAGTVAGPSAIGNRYCIMPKGKDPIMFEIGGDVGRTRLCAPWLSGRIRIATPMRMMPAEMAEQWAFQVKEILQEEGADGGCIGIDMINFRLIEAFKKAGIEYIDAMPLMWEARMIKTKEEIECIKQSVAIAEPSLYAAEKMLRPGVRECDIQVEMAKVLHSLSAEGLAVVASGDHTNPYWRRPLNDKMLRPNDLVVIDRFHNLNGYWCDYVRTFLCGEKATKEQKELFKIAYDRLYEAINEVRPGASTKTIAEKLNEPEDLSEFTLQFGHGMGLSVHEPPYITYFSKEYPVEIKEGMVLAIENYVGRPGGKDGVRLEENLVVTENGYEIISKYPFDPKLMD